MKTIFVMASILLASCMPHMELKHQGLDDAEAFLTALGKSYHFGPGWIPIAGAVDYALHGRTEILILY